MLFTFFMTRGKVAQLQLLSHKIGLGNEVRKWIKTEFWRISVHTNNESRKKEKEKKETKIHISLRKQITHLEYRFPGTPKHNCIITRLAWLGVVKTKPSGHIFPAMSYCLGVISLSRLSPNHTITSPHTQSHTIHPTVPHFHLQNHSYFPTILSDSDWNYWLSETFKLSLLLLLWSNTFYGIRNDDTTDFMN